MPLFACPGLPPDSDKVHCASNVTNSTCYFYYSQATYTISKAKCQAMGGWLVAWNRAEEQLAVENYFKGEGKH